MKNFTRVLLGITTIIALVEFTIMYIYANLSFRFQPLVEALVDSILLSVISAPIIYFKIIKPYIFRHDKVVAQIKNLAFLDPLTQLANRRLLNECMIKEMSMLARQQLYGAVVFMDLDGFKKVNDKFGHDAGDAVLIKVAKRLKSLVRQEDTVCRLGGDEFVIIISQLKGNQQLAIKGAVELSRRIQTELEREIKFQGSVLKVGVSIGLRMLSPEKSDVQTVLKDADKAMYIAKQNKTQKIIVHEFASGVFS